MKARVHCLTLTPTDHNVVQNMLFQHPSNTATYKPYYLNIITVGSCKITETFINDFLLQSDTLACSQLNHFLTVFVMEFLRYSIVYCSQSYQYLCLSKC